MKNKIKFLKFWKRPLFDFNEYAFKYLHDLHKGLRSPASTDLKFPYHFTFLNECISEVSDWNYIFHWIAREFKIVDDVMSTMICVIE